MNLKCDNCRFAQRFKEECGAHHERWIGEPRKCRVALILYGHNSSHIDGDGYIDDRNEFGILPNCPRKKYSEKECFDIVKSDDVRIVKNKIDLNNSKIQKLNRDNDNLIDQLIIILEEELTD